MADKDYKSSRKLSLRPGESACLGCGERLTYCGKPFTADIACPKCGAINLYRESQKPERVLVSA
jgi:hypothetical protein